MSMFQNRKWEMPESLSAKGPGVQEEMTLWKAIDLFLNYPGIKDSRERERYVYAFIPLVKHFGRDCLVKRLWVPDLRVYQAKRQGNAAPSTINREVGTLSKLFGALIELKVMDTNPARLLRRLSTKSNERQAYLSWQDVNLIAGKCPEWYRPMIWVAYYSGMRRGEILDMKWGQVDLKTRIITLKPTDTKEGHWKRIPVRQELVDILERDGAVRTLGPVHVFLLDGKPVDIETFKNCWPRACERLKKAGLLRDPLPRFHDLRHTWKTNALSSGMDIEIRESILGHQNRGRSVMERYGRLMDQKLVEAVDAMTFEHGGTEICVAK